jgi:hypothetical protein
MFPNCSETKRRILETCADTESGSEAKRRWVISPSSCSLALIASTSAGGVSAAGGGLD